MVTNKEDIQNGSRKNLQNHINFAQATSDAGAKQLDKISEHG
jgi:hypothetical protein